MKSYIIITGGRVDLYSLQGIMDRHLESSRVIAVDKGIETYNKIGIVRRSGYAQGLYGYACCNYARY